jgi:hypothetical protein
MPPILQTLVALAVRILLRFLFLREVSLAVCHHLPHMIDIVLLIAVRILLWVLLQDSNDLASRIVPDGLAAAVVLRPAGASGLFAPEPVLQLFRRHVDELVELSERAVSSSLQVLDIVTYSITVSLSLTMLDRGDSG